MQKYKVQKHQSANNRNTETQIQIKKRYTEIPHRYINHIYTEIQLKKHRNTEV